MGKPMDRDGIFQIAIREYGLTERDSGAVAISVIADVTAEWNAETGEWDDWTSYDMEVRGDLYIVKKDKSLNNSQIEALCRHAGWNADVNSITDLSWVPTPCQCTVEADVYKEQTRYKIGFLNALDRVPGGAVGNISPEKVKAIATQYGSQLRAIAGTTLHGTTKPAGKPPAPNRRVVDKSPYPDTNALDDANAALQEEGTKNRRGGEPIDEPDFVKN